MAETEGSLTDNAQYAILRFAKYKGPEISNIEAHGAIPLADRLDKRKRPGTFFGLDSRGHRSDRTPSPEEPSESPRHFAASMDESVIVGYYTLKKCLSKAPRPSQILSERSMTHGKK